MSDLLKAFIYSNSAKALFKICEAGLICGIARFLITDTSVKASMYGAALALAAGASAELGVVGTRAVTTTPFNPPDSKGDKKF